MSRLTVSSERGTTSPRTEITHSERSSCDARVRLGRGLRVEHDLHDARCGRAGPRTRGRRGRGAGAPSPRPAPLADAARRAPRRTRCRGRSFGRRLRPARRSSSSRRRDERDLVLLAAAHVAHGRRLALPLLGPDDHDPRRAQALGLAHLRLQRAGAEVDRRADPLLAQLRDRPEHPLAGARLAHDEEELRPPASGRAAAPATRSPRLQRLLDALQPGRPSRARASAGRRAARSGGRSGRRRRCRSARPARRSGTRTPCACSSRARAPAAGRARSRSPAPSSRRRTSSKCSASASLRPVDHLRRRLRDRHDLGSVPVERAHRVDLDPGALLGVEHVVAEQVVAQLARVLGARLRVADARQVQPHAGQAAGARTGARAGRSARRRPRGRRSRSSRRRPGRAGGSGPTAARS